MLISPVLLNTDRRWKLRSFEGEFGAVIRDERFLNDVVSGAHPLPMVSGIEMDVLLETTAEFAGGVWRPLDRAVLEVQMVRLPGIQGTLDLVPSRKKPKKRAEKDGDRK